MKTSRVLAVAAAFLFSAAAIGMVMLVGGCASNQTSTQTQVATLANSAFAVGDATLAIYQQQADDAQATVDVAQANLNAAPTNTALQQALAIKQKDLMRKESTLATYRAYLSIAKVFAPILVNPPQVVPVPVVSTQPAH